MHIRRWFFIFLLICLKSFPVSAQADSCHVEISLLTCGPGEELYSTFGHTAIRVKNLSAHTDTVYNYGTFDDSDPYFYVKFTKGIMVYSLSVEPFSYFMQEYIYEHRSVVEQILRLSCTEKEKLLAALQANSQEFNRYYNYHFYNDNCTLRARDIIVRNSVAPISFENILPDQHTTFRNFINSYLDRGNQYWSKFGINILMGSHLDDDMTNDQAMFLPDYLMKGFANGIKADTPLVKETRQLLGGNNQSLNNSSWFTPGVLFTLLLIASVVISFLKSQWSKTALTIFDCIIFFFVGLLGILMLFLWLGRVDTVCRNNINILWAWPTHTIVIFFTRKMKSWVRNYFRISALISIILLVGWKFWPQELPLSVIPLLLLIIFRSMSIAQKK
ncbi:MAG: DUF4105 domain-containing protein [Bacteroidetes bacterium]|nr:DUF4105 domain-containing protein [Bacteroidota bacterium]